MRTVNQIIGENMKEIRKSFGFSQEKFAKFLAIERSAYSNYESGDREVPYNIVEKVANMFGCDPIVLFEENIRENSEIMTTAFRISNLEENDFNEIAYFKDIVKSYLKMKRIARNEAK